LDEKFNKTPIVEEKKVTNEKDTKEGIDNRDICKRQLQHCQMQQTVMAWQNPKICIPRMGWNGWMIRGIWCES